jgi:hypothetical protein
MLRQPEAFARCLTKSFDKLSGGNNMAGNKLTITLTDDQQKQIRDATGKSIKELNIDLSSTGQLSEDDLGRMAGGAIDSYLKNT